MKDLLWCPRVRRLQDRERQLTSQISETQYREAEYKVHRQNLESELARLMSGSSKFEVKSGVDPSDQRFKFRTEHRIH